MRVKISGGFIIDSLATEAQRHRGKTLDFKPLDRSFASLCVSVSPWQILEFVVMRTIGIANDVVFRHHVRGQELPYFFQGLHKMFLGHHF